MVRSFGGGGGTIIIIIIIIVVMDDILKMPTEKKKKMTFMKWHQSGWLGVGVAAAMSKDLARTVNFKPRGKFFCCVFFFFFF